jgi:hypothetical protein
MRILSICGLVAAVAAAATPARAGKPEARSPQDVAAEVDRVILTELQRAGQPVAPLAGDEDYLRRVSFDIAGTPPTPRDVTLFGLNPDADKRAKLVEQLLASPNFGKNWGSYWRDVVYLPATNMRARGANAVFEQWMVEQLNANRSWDAIVTDILTATGNVNENGATGLIFAHSAEAPEVAAEACRIFLGIQIQCANCHDHPSDVWKREQFHELAAYFPRAGLRPVVVDGQQRGFEVVSNNQSRRPGMGGTMLDNPERTFALLDRNRDGKITKREVENSPFFGPAFDRLLLVGDADKDGALSLAEFKAMPAPQMQGRGSSEYFMPDLNNPSSRGTVVQPKFFVDDSQPGQGLSDEARRQAAAKAFTDADNPWFARAVINRVWNEMLGEGFYMPVDDLGPTREARFPQALDVLAAGFVGSGYDLKWLVQTVALTQTYQRQVRSKPVSETALPFASQTPTRLRSDQLYNALATVLGFSEQSASPRGGMMPGGGIYAGNRGPRSQFNAVFTFDPSTPQEDITGNVQQALTLMNSPQFRGALSAGGNTRLGRILRQHTDDQDAISEVYLLALSREPSDRELKLSRQYIADVGNRGEAYEDLLWTLVNSSEFVSKR